MPEVRELFQRVKPDVPFMRGVRGTYLLDIEGAGNWFITVNDGAITIDQSTHDADCVIQCSAEDFVEIVEGRRNMYTAPLQGRFRVRGPFGPELAATTLRVLALRRGLIDIPDVPVGARVVADARQVVAVPLEQPIPKAS